jgi:hypothetical protein
MPPHLLGFLQEGVEVRPWLERHLVGPDLLAVVAELTAVGGREADADAGGLLVAHRTEVLERGLASLTDEEVQVLFRNPSLLLRLQEWVLVDGGPYWDGVLSGSATRPPAPLPPRGPGRTRTFRLGSWVSHAAAAAAAAALVWLLGGHRPAPPPGDGGTEVAAAKPADAVLPALAARLDRRWAALRRQDDAAAALREMQQTCAALAALPLPQLSEPARAAVRHDLARLREEIEVQRHRLEQGGDVGRVRAAVESRVNALLWTRWRDPGDLPESDRDPDDLPPPPLDA